MKLSMFHHPTYSDGRKLDDDDEIFNIALMMIILLKLGQVVDNKLLSDS